MYVLTKIWPWMFIADLSSMVLKILSMAIRGEKKLSPNWKRRSKIVTFADDITILHIENMKDVATAQK